MLLGRAGAPTLNLKISARKLLPQKSYRRGTQMPFKYLSVKSHYFNFRGSLAEHALILLSEAKTYKSMEESRDYRELL